MPRTMMSTALASSRVNFVCRRAIELVRQNQRGTPKYADEADDQRQQLRVSAEGGSASVTSKANNDAANGARQPDRPAA